MLRRIITLLSTLALGAGMALAATAPASATTYYGPYYLCDGAGTGSCLSLPANGVINPGQPLYAIGMNSGAWRWDVTILGTVTSSTFSDQNIDTALSGMPIYKLHLYDDTSYCARNSGGGVILNSCSGENSQWAFDSAKNYFVNVGRSNYKDNWEVLCNPGGGYQQEVTTRDSCTSYHRQWGF